MKEPKMDLEFEPQKFLRVVKNGRHSEDYLAMMNSLLIAEATLAVKSETALRHFIAVVKHLEEIHGFEFKEYTQEELDTEIAALRKSLKDKSDQMNSIPHFTAPF